MGRCAVHSAWIERAAGPGWIAIGDAALACDPLSARGLFNGLYTALLGAGAVREVLATGRTDALREYQGAVDNMREAYPRWPARLVRFGGPMDRPAVLEPPLKHRRQGQCLAVNC
jgi:flavin-dependent dehydrogenase